MSLTKQQIIDDLRAIGVGPGMTLMVHSSLSALGHVEGGAQTVIDALLECIGPEGTLAMPAISGGGVFEIDRSPATVGAITEAFRLRPRVKRSFHPTHSACAIGPKADFLLEDTLDQPTAIGTESPWGRLARLPEGHVLLLGVDQDRNTLLHYPEEIVRAPYLNTIERQYRDEAGQVRTKTIELFPGPHRDFIGLEPLLREGKAMRVGRVGDAMARLMHAGTTVEIVTEALRADPAAVLCDNPLCDDCVMQRARIKEHDLEQYDFTASALLDELTDDLEQSRGALMTVRNEGIRTVELGPSLGAQLAAGGAGREALLAALEELAMDVSAIHCGLAPGEIADREVARQRVSHASQLARDLGCELVLIPSPPADSASPAEILRSACADVGDGVTVVFENVPGSVWTTGDQCDETLLEVGEQCRVGFAFNPAHFANAGERPFLQTWRSTKLKRFTRIIYITDGGFPGRPRYTPPLEGNGEVKEIVSIFRARTFDGFVTLKMGDRRGAEQFRCQAAAFRRLLAES